MSFVPVLMFKNWTVALTLFVFIDTDAFSNLFLSNWCFSFFYLWVCSYFSAILTWGSTFFFSRSERRPQRGRQWQSNSPPSERQVVVSTGHTVCDSYIPELNAWRIVTYEIRTRHRSYMRQTLTPKRRLRVFSHLCCPQLISIRGGT